MKIAALFVTVSLHVLMSTASAEETHIFNPWRYLTDSHYRAERVKHNQAETRRLLPILGRIRACEIAEEIVGAPTEWQDNTRRIAAIPSILHAYGVESTDDFKTFQTSAIAITEFSAQLQSVTSGQLARQLASESEHSSHSVNVEAAIDPKLLARYVGSTESERKMSAERTYTEKRERPAMTSEQGATFQKLYHQLVNDYEAVTKKLPRTDEILGLEQPKQ